METSPEAPKVHARANLQNTGRSAFYTLTAFCVALLAGVSLYLFRAHLGLILWEDGDEAHCFVAAQMIFKGHYLYRDIFIQHGPLPVMISHLYAAVVSPNDFSDVRIAPILLVLASCAAILLSPVLKTWSARTFAIAVYIALLSAIWLPKFLNMVLYPSIGGYFFAILLAQCIVPLYFRERLTFWNLFVGGASFALAGFTAYIFFFSGVLFILSSLASVPMQAPESRQYLRAFLLGTIAVTTGVVAWLLIFGDIPGYFIYHIYFNQEIYSKFLGDYYSHIWVLNNLSLSVEPVRVIQTVTIALMSGWILIFLNFKTISQPRLSLGMRVAAVGLIACGVLFTNPSGDIVEDHNTAFLIPNFALSALALALLAPQSIGALGKWRSGWVIASAIVAVLLMEWAGSLTEKSFGLTNANEPTAQMKPQNSEIYQFVRSITREDGDLLSLEYNPMVYIRAARLPASGIFFYLPWQAMYNRNPFKGYALDVCSDMSQRRPAVIWFFNWRVWNKYAIETYEPCVLVHIVKEYAPIGFNSPWYVRNDILEKYTAPLPRDPESDASMKGILQQTEKVGSGPIHLTMTPEHERRAVRLSRLGILFASSPSQGDAELTLRGPDGATFSTRFSLSGISPNRYHYFDLRPNVYKAAEIQTPSSSEIRLWEGHLDQTNVCMIYEYIDGSRGYTPACPVLDPFSRNTAASAEPRPLTGMSTLASMAR